MAKTGVRLIVLGALFWGAINAFSASTAVAEPLPGPRSESRAATVRVDGFEFPRRLGGMTRVRVIDYGRPGAGKGIRYASAGEASWADVFVYDRQMDLTRGARSRLARAEMRRAVQGLQFMVRLKRYKSVKLTGRTSSDLFEAARFHVVSDKRSTTSFLFLSVHRGKFVKIRLSTPPGPNASVVAASFMTDLTSTLGLHWESGGQTL